MICLAYRIWEIKVKDLLYLFTYRKLKTCLVVTRKLLFDFDCILKHHLIEIYNISNIRGNMLYFHFIFVIYIYIYIFIVSTNGIVILYYNVLAIVEEHYSTFKILWNAVKFDVIDNKEIYFYIIFCGAATKKLLYLLGKVVIIMKIVRSY